MPATSIQVPVLMSPAQKARLARKARAAGLTMGELLRQGGERFAPQEDLTMLDHLAKNVIRTTNKAIRSIDKTLSVVAESEARIAAMTKAHKKR